MIGDPKQAIYSFRGGSLNTYMKAREACDRIDLMNANYRSTKSLILTGLGQYLETHRLMQLYI